MPFSNRSGLPCPAMDTRKRIPPTSRNSVDAAAAFRAVAAPPPMELAPFTPSVSWTVSSTSRRRKPRRNPYLCFWWT